MSDIRLYRVMRDLEGKHCGNEYLGNLVTCGECKHRQNPYAPKWCYEMSKETDADDYCSYGERSRR